MTATMEWAPSYMLPLRVRWQLDGIEFNAAADPLDGCEYIITEEVGWSGSPAVRTSRQAVPSAHGEYSGPQWKDGRGITLAGVVAAPTWEARRAAEHRLAALCDHPSALYPLVCTEELGDVTAWVKLDGEVLVSIRQGGHHLDFSLQLRAPDPRKYLAERSAYPALPTSGGGGLDWSTGGGLNWSTGGGLNWGPAGSTGLAEIDNSTGTAETWPRFRIDGPSNPADPALDNPTITAGTAQLLYAGSLGHGEYVLLDSHPTRHSVLYGGTIRHGHLLTRRGWFSAAKGTVLPVAFGASSVSPSAQLTVTWSPALA